MLPSRRGSFPCQLGSRGKKGSDSEFHSVNDEREENVNKEDKNEPEKETRPEKNEPGKENLAEKIEPSNESCQLCPESFLNKDLDKVLEHYFIHLESSLEESCGYLISQD